MLCMVLVVPPPKFFFSFKSKSMFIVGLKPSLYFSITLRVFRPAEYLFIALGIRNQMFNLESPSTLEINVLRDQKRNLGFCLVARQVR